MPSIFGHVIVGISSTYIFKNKKYFRSVLILSIICTIIPDIDVISFAFNIPYDSFWGHRGFTHSILFALLFSTLLTSFYFNKKITLKSKIFILFTFLISTLSHPLLDALTNGGLGVALLSPFSNERIFFDYRPILVSPIGITSFFSIRGLNVLKSELFFIGFPTLIIVSIVTIIRRLNK